VSDFDVVPRLHPTLSHPLPTRCPTKEFTVAVCCSVFQYVAMRRSVLQHVRSRRRNASSSSSVTPPTNPLPCERCHSCSVLQCGVVCYKCCSVIRVKRRHRSALSTQTSQCIIVFPCATYRIYTCRMPHCDMTHPCVCDMVHSHVWLDSCIRVA